MGLARDERGLVTLETTLMVVILVPLLFGVIEFGWLFQRWLAADTVAVHAARYAGELGGDDPALRAYVARELTDVGIEVTQRISSLAVTKPDGSSAVREVKMAFLKFPGQEFVFELAERKVPDDGISPVFQHVGVDVVDIDVAAKRVEAAGGQGFTGIAVVEGQGVKAKTAFFKGPDGENVELMQILSGTF